MGSRTLRSDVEWVWSRTLRSDGDTDSTGARMGGAGGWTDASESTTTTSTSSGSDPSTSGMGGCNSSTSIVSECCVVSSASTVPPYVDGAIWSVHRRNVAAIRPSTPFRSTGPDSDGDPSDDEGHPDGLSSDAPVVGPDAPPAAAFSRSMWNVAPVRSAMPIASSAMSTCGAIANGDGARWTIRRATTTRPVADDRPLASAFGHHAPS